MTAADLPADYFNRPLAEVDPEIADVLARELDRQQRTLEMIASENFAPAAVLECQGSVLNKQVRRGLSGQALLRRLRVRRHRRAAGDRPGQVPVRGPSTPTSSRTPAPRPTPPVYHALLQPGDTLNGPRAGPRRPPVARHEDQRVGPAVRTSSPTHVDRETSLIDMDEVAELAQLHRPKMIVAGWSAYPRQLDFERFREIADSVGAYLMVDMAHFAGLVAAGLHPSRSRWRTSSPRRSTRRSAAVAAA